MDDFSGFASGSGDLFRLIGGGWVGALLVVGIAILAGRLLLDWQLRQIDRLMGQKGDLRQRGEALRPRKLAWVNPPKRAQAP